MASPAYISGARDVQADQDDHILDLEDGLDFLNPKQDGVAFMKKIGMNGSPVKSWKHEWTETALAVRRETSSLAADSTTNLVVADAFQYAVDDILRVEDEIVRISAIVDATNVTIVRGQADTTAAAHASKEFIYLGNAREENSTATTATSSGITRLYNYVQTFDRAVEMSSHEIAQLSTQGNPFTAELKRQFIVAVRNLTAAFFYGVRYADTTNKRYYAGGLKQFITSNVTNVAGALTNAAIDALVKSIVDAGGQPDTIVVSTSVKQDMDALDASIIRTDKSTSLGGVMDVQTWQSGVLDYPLHVIVDHTLNTDELWILDSSKLDVKPMKNNGAGHGFRLKEATTPGQDGRETRLLGHYTFQVDTEAGHGYLYGLT